MYLTREMTQLSLPQIGQSFGGRDHSTILHSCNEIGKRVRVDTDLARQVSDIRQLVQGE